VPVTTAPRDAASADAVACARANAYTASYCFVCQFVCFLCVRLFFCAWKSAHRDTQGEQM
jgi:hypothetical protein